MRSHTVSKVFTTPIQCMNEQMDMNIDSIPTVTTKTNILYPQQCPVAILFEYCHAI